MKYALLALLAISFNSFGAQPSRDIVFSCLAFNAVSQKVKLKDLPVEIWTENDYRDGYDATYLLKLKGKKSGYLTKRSGDALIVNDKIVPLNKALFLYQPQYASPTFDPLSAIWMTASDKSGNFFCASFPFGAFGKMGMHQYIRGVYLISMDKTKKAPALYYTLQDTRDY